ncbi:MAG: hypothetical protein IRY99_20680, partial [Isosphaeraceae bacterium]|nr:hypothetical protein [Isosphaeraceae bacterium]
MTAAEAAPASDNRDQPHRRAAGPDPMGIELPTPGAEVEVIAARAAPGSSVLKPENSFETWLVQQVALASVRLEHCVHYEAAQRALLARRAALCWEEDRWVAVEEPGAKLAKDPARIARKLRQTKQGCAWLLVRWRFLEMILRDGGVWDDDQHRFALDLLGTARDQRGGHD